MEALSTPIEPAILTLVDTAERGRLCVCAGAGLSRGVVPDGAQLAQLLHEELSKRMAGYSCDHPDNLLDVADAAGALPGGLEALQRIALKLADFDTADPQPEHRLLALLVCEGALRLLVTNWDTCVERAWIEELTPVRDAQEAADTDRGGVMKIHGCARRPSTLLVTRLQLDEAAPIWAQVHLSASLATSSVVFVGIGDVASYARRRIGELAEAIPHADARVVSPSIRAGWDQSEWNDVLPDLPDANKLEMTAEQLADDLARGWVVRSLIDPLTAAHPQGDSLAQQIAELTGAFQRLTAEQALVWLRSARWRPEVGESVARSAAAHAAFTAMAVSITPGAGSDRPAAVAFFTTPAVKLGADRYEVLLGRDGTRTSDINRAAVDRARQIAPSLPKGSTVRVLCSVPMLTGPRASSLDNVEVLDPTVPIDEVIDGPVRAQVELIYADDLLRAA